MQSRMRGVTTLSIAHRLSTIASADVIVVLHHGRVEEVGNHSALVSRRGGRYAKLVESQQSARGVGVGTGH